MYVYIILIRRKLNIFYNYNAASENDGKCSLSPHKSKCVVFSRNFIAIQ